jgi:hypothetical protein
MLGDSDKHDVRGMHFEHVAYFGRPIAKDSPCVEIGPHVADVTFSD